MKTAQTRKIGDTQHPEVRNLAHGDIKLVLDCPCWAKTQKIMFFMKRTPTHIAWQ